jgi:hypothetical protein
MVASGDGGTALGALIRLGSLSLVLRPAGRTSPVFLLGRPMRQGGKKLGVGAASGISAPEGSQEAQDAVDSKRR